MKSYGVKMKPGAMVRGAGAYKVFVAWFIGSPMPSFLRRFAQRLNRACKKDIARKARQYRKLRVWERSLLDPDIQAQPGWVTRRLA